jgi:hypothetical protein
LNFYTTTPCRLADTRSQFHGNLGGPTMAAGSTRTFPLPQAYCDEELGQAYSLNITVVPDGPLGYLSIWPTGEPRPLVSTLNAWNGQIAANAAIVPSGIGGSLNLFVTNTTDVIIDINGYFAP